MWTRIAPLGALLLVTAALRAEPRRPVISENWYAKLAAAPINVDALRMDMRRLVGLEKSSLMLSESNLPDAREIDVFDISDSARRWLADTRFASGRTPDAGIDRYALLWDESVTESTGFEPSPTDRDSVGTTGESETAETALERLFASEALSSEGNIRGLVLAD